MTVLGLFLNAEMRSGGHKRYLELLEGLAARGVRTVALFNRSQPVRPALVEAVELGIRRRPFVPASLSFAKAAERGIRLLPPDLGKIDWIVVFGESHLAGALILKRRLGAALLYSHRSNSLREGFIALKEEGWNPRKAATNLSNIIVARLYERKIARNADIVVFQSPYDRDDFISREKGCAERSVVIRGNIGEPRFRKEYSDANRSASARRILFIGTFGIRKGVRYFLEAAAILASRGYGDLRFDLIGFGQRRSEFEDFALKAGIADRVTFRGRLRDPLPLLAAADLLVVPSLFDSYPNTVLEALHVGTPVIASAIGGIPDMLRHEELLFPIRDAAAIADRIERCATDDRYYERIRALCAERKTDFLFDWTNAFIAAMAARPAPGRAAAPRPKEYTQQ